MTLDDIRELVVSADPAARHYESRWTEGAYTTWTEYRRLAFTADDRHDEGWAFQVDRFTMDEDDDVAKRIFQVLDADERVAVEHMVEYENDTGYIHHIFDCEGY